jgi:response regulator NasT
MSVKKVVIVDDEPIVRLDLMSMLQDVGFIVMGEAADGFDAVELCRSVHPDIVLMDIKMPTFDGLNAAEAILKEKLSSCVVLLTAFSDMQFIEKAKQAGVMGYLIKPITQCMLVPAIEVAYSQSLRLKKSELETDSALKKLEESRIIERAKVLLAKERGISESEAYRELQQAAMDKRRPLFSLAQTVVQSYSQREVLNKAKNVMMESEGLSERAAFKRLKTRSQTGDISLQQAAFQILSEK